MKATIAYFGSPLIQGLRAVAGKLRRSLPAAIIAGFGMANPMVGQSPAIADSWGHLAALPAQTRIHIKADGGSKTCRFAAADDEKLTCVTGSGSSPNRVTFTRAEVKSVKLAGRTASTLAGAGIGGAAGAAVGGTIAYRNRNDFFSFPAAVTGIGAGAGVLIGGAVGAATDFLHGATLYRRPASDGPSGKRRGHRD